jgi:hypothetical protein
MVCPAFARGALYFRAYVRLTSATGFTVGSITEVVNSSAMPKDVGVTEVNPGPMIAPASEPAAPAQPAAPIAIAPLAPIAAPAPIQHEHQGAFGHDSVGHQGGWAGPGAHGAEVDHAASRLSAAGVSDLFVAQMIGHNSPGILQKYSKAIDAYRRDAVRKLEGMRAEYVLERRESAKTTTVLLQ